MKKEKIIKLFDYMIEQVNYRSITFQKSRKKIPGLKTYYSQTSERSGLSCPGLEVCCSFERFTNGDIKVTLYDLKYENRIVSDEINLKEIIGYDVILLSYKNTLAGIVPLVNTKKELSEWLDILKQYKENLSDSKKLFWYRIDSRMNDLAENIFYATHIDN